MTKAEVKDLHRSKTKDCIKRISEKGYLMMDYRIKSIVGHLPNEVCVNTFCKVWGISGHGVKVNTQETIELCICALNCLVLYTL